MQAVCSGFVYALAIADRMVASGMARNALVVGAEIYSRILDWNDRGTCVLFGDGAGAVVLAPSREPGILIVAPACRRPLRRHPLRAGPGRATAGRAARRSCSMDGGAVFKFAVKVLAEVAHEALAARGHERTATSTG